MKWNELDPSKMVSWLPRLHIIDNLANYSVLLKKLSMVFMGFGTGTGGMHVGIQTCSFFFLNDKELLSLTLSRHAWQRQKRKSSAHDLAYPTQATPYFAIFPLLLQHMVAFSADGPHIPAVPAVIIAQKLALKIKSNK